MLEKLNTIRVSIRNYLFRPGNQNKIGFIFLFFVTVLLVGLGLFKIFGGEYAHEFYKNFNLDSYYRIRIGLIELIAALMLWSNKTSKLGLYLVLCLMGGAVAVHIMTSTPGIKIPIFIGILSFIGVSIRKHGFRIKLWF